MIEHLNDVVIVSALRTPMGSFGGDLSSLSCTQLGSIAIKGAVNSLNPLPNVGEVIMGAVLTAGLGQAPARQASIGAGLSSAIPCMTINKVCGSGLQAIMLGSDSIRLGRVKVVVVGGMESMSNTPMLLSRGRSSFPYGHQKLHDSLISDGLWDIYNDFHMGNAGELCA